MSNTSDSSFLFESNPKPVPPEERAKQLIDPGFGKVFTDHMAIAEYEEGKGWHDELTEERSALHFGDPYAEQMRHFRAVIEGEEEPVCSADDAMRSLEATLAVAEAARSGTEIVLSERGENGEAPA